MKVDLSVALIAATMFCSSTAISSLKEPLVNIFVSSYNHSVTSFRLTPQERVPWALQTTEVTQDCGINPSWLTFDTSKRYLYCLNEGINQNTGSVTALSVSKSGSFTTIGKKSLLPGPVSGYLSRRGTSSALFVAHYRSVINNNVVWK
jgi:6-phosphogluconolactonase (cycloisomerase 2 family)